MGFGIFDFDDCIGTREKEVYVHPEVPAYAGWGWHFGVEHVSIDSDVAEDENIRDSATAFNFAAEYFMADKPLELHIGVSLIQYGGYAEFSVSGVYEGGYNDGERGTETSDASAVQLYAEYGLKKRFGPSKGGFYTKRGGYGAIFASERAVPNCTGQCGGSDIDVSDGPIWLSWHRFQCNAKPLEGLNLKQYFSGDLGTTFGLDLRWAY